MKIAFIGCSATKRSSACIARELYQGNIFKKALRLCEKLKYDKIFILSAKYGLVLIDQIIDPYEQTLNKITISKRKEWSKKVMWQLKEKIQLTDELTFYCGKNYYFYIAQWLPNKKNYPLKNLSMGYSLQELNKLLKAAI